MKLCICRCYINRNQRRFSHGRLVVVVVAGVHHPPGFRLVAANNDESGRRSLHFVLVSFAGNGEFSPRRAAASEVRLHLGETAGENLKCSIFGEMLVAVRKD